MTLLETASTILDSAALGAASAVTILMRGGKPFEVSVANDWALDSLLREKGADEVFRVRRSNGCIQVEGKSHTDSCRISRQPRPRTATPAPARPLLM